MKMRIRKFDGMYLVHSETQRGVWYAVNIYSQGTGDPFGCACDGDRNPFSICKHLRAVLRKEGYPVDMEERGKTLMELYHEGRL